VLAKELGDDRRTKIIADEAEDISTEDLIAREDMAITITRDGYIKRMPLDTYRLQNRGGRGVVALSKKEEDSVRDIFVATTHHLILVFTNQGRVYRLRAYQVPMASRTARGTPIINLVPLEAGEQVTAWVPVRSFDQGGYLVMVTRQGKIKKTATIPPSRRAGSSPSTCVTATGWNGSCGPMAPRTSCWPPSSARPCVSPSAACDRWAAMPPA